MIHQEIGDMKSFKVTPRMLDNYSTIWQSKQSNNLPEPLEEESQGVQERGDKENEALIDQLNLNPEHAGNSQNKRKFNEISGDSEESLQFKNYKQNSSGKIVPESPVFIHLNSQSKVKGVQLNKQN